MPKLGSSTDNSVCFTSSVTFAKLFYFSELILLWDSFLGGRWSRGPFVKMEIVFALLIDL